jgi:hypothetical protein
MADRLAMLFSDQPAERDASRARWKAIDMAKAEAAAGATLSADAITRNPWNAVYMSIDDPGLQSAALKTARGLARDASKDWVARGLNGDGFAADDAQDAALRLADALGERRDLTHDRNR